MLAKILSAWAIIFCLFSLLPFLTVYLLTVNISPAVGVSFTPLIYSMCICLLIGFSDEITSSDETDTEKQVDRNSQTALILGILPGILACFPVICQALYTISPSAFVGAVENNSWQWFNYMIDNILESIFFDIPTVFDIHLSQIKPQSTVSRGIVVLFRIILNSLVFSSLYLIWKNHKSTTPQTEEAKASLLSRLLLPTIFTLGLITSICSFVYFLT